MSARLTRWVLVAAFIVLAASPAAADRYHVRGTGTLTSGPSSPTNWLDENCYPTVAAAVVQATPADSVLLYDEEHTVTTEVVADVALIGNMYLSAVATDAVLLVGAGGSLTWSGLHPALRLQGLSFQGAPGDRPQSAVWGSSATLVLVGCDFTGFSMQDVGHVAGPALRLIEGGDLWAESCRFVGNAALGRGGAVYLGDGLSAEFQQCEWHDNSARTGADPRGGAVFADGRVVHSSLTFRDCMFQDNLCGGPGGAVSVISVTTLYEDCTVRGSRSGQDNGWSEGAGLHHRRNSGDQTTLVSATVRRCCFEDNKGATDIELNGGDGGAFYTSGADTDLFIDVVVEDSEFRDNYNLQGSGVYVSRWSQGVVRRCRFVDNIAYFMAGGVFKGGHFYSNRGETLEVDQCLFIRNLAGFDVEGVPTDDYARAGAMCCRMRPRIIARHCTFVDNVVAESGYRFGDAFAHYFETGVWEPEMLCVLQNCVFWGTGGTHVQVYSSDGGMEAVENCAAAEGELSLGGLLATGTVTLTESPFVSLGTGYPLSPGPLLDAALDLGFSTDIEGAPVPYGPAPDIGCFEWHNLLPVADAPGANPVLTAGPNPFNPRTVLSCRLADAADIGLVLHDARGRRVRSLWNGMVQAGEHAWTWDGRDDAGRDCAAGVYLARLVVDGRQVDTNKLTLVR